MIESKLPEKLPGLILIWLHRFCSVVRMILMVAMEDITFLPSNGFITIILLMRPVRSTRPEDTIMVSNVHQRSSVKIVPQERRDVGLSQTLTSTELMSTVQSRERRT